MWKKKTHTKNGYLVGKTLTNWPQLFGTLLQTSICLCFTGNIIWNKVKELLELMLKFLL